MGRKHIFIGTVHLYYKGKCYGATSRQVAAANKKSARNKLKQKFKFPGNRVTVTDIHKPTRGKK